MLLRSHFVQHLLRMPEPAAGRKEMSQRCESVQAVREIARLLELLLGFFSQSLLLVNQAEQFIRGRKRAFTFIS